MLSCNEIAPSLKTTEVPFMTPLPKTCPSESVEHFPTIAKEDAIKY